MQAYNGVGAGAGQNSGDLGGFDFQQNFDGQFDFGSEQGFGNQNQGYYQTPNPNQAPRVPQQNFGSQSQSQAGPNPRQRMRNPQQNQSGFSQDQVPFPNNGHLGQ